MNKAEQRANEAFPYKGGVKGDICDSLKPIFIQGYEQAEQDLALTWEDVREILLIDLELSEKCFVPGKKYCEEVLRRFLEQRAKK